jgi:hypothetical protein
VGTGKRTDERAGVGFAADDGASLLMAFRGLQAEAGKTADAHRTIAHELDTLVADPFADWAAGHRARVLASKAALLQQHVRGYELAQGEVTRLKNAYLSKTRKADEAEDECAPSARVYICICADACPPQCPLRADSRAEPGQVHDVPTAWAVGAAGPAEP